MKRRAIILVLINIICLLVSTKIYAATFNLSASKSSANVGDSFTVTISGLNGRVTISANANVSVSPTGSQWIDGSLTLSGTATSAGTGPRLLRSL